MNKREQKGITIVVLTITIIVLLILAGVSISMIVKSTIVDDTEELVNSADEVMDKDRKMKDEVRNLYR